MLEIHVLTSESMMKNEAEAINQMMASGLDYLHVRKPACSNDEIRQLLNEIDPSYHKNVVLHRNSLLLSGYKLGAYHHKATQEQLQFDGLLSTSVHSWQEYHNFYNNYDMLFISPFFNSISKEGYKKNETLINIPLDIQADKAIALGGLQPDKIAWFEEKQFRGVAFLGYVWNSQNPIARWNEIMKRT